MKKLFSAQYGNITFSYVFSLNSMKKNAGYNQARNKKTTAYEKKGRQDYEKNR